MTTTFRFAAALLLTGLVLWGCSRKQDQVLPPRTGDLLVQFTIHEESSHLPDPSHIPVTVTLYRDSVHAVVAQSQDIVVASDSLAQVSFSDLSVDFYWLEIQVTENDLPPSCPATRVFIQQDITSKTGNLEYTLRQDLWVCPGFAKK